MSAAQPANDIDLARAGARHIVRHCGGLQCGETVVVVSDASTRAVAELLAEEAIAVGGKVTLLEVSAFDMHGQEPEPSVATAMCAAKLIFGVTSKSMAHTSARRDACNAGARYLSLPEFSLGLLADPAVMINYHEAGALARRVADVFTAGRYARVTTALGTDITLSLEGRTGNCCPGYVAKPGELGSPPDIEANISPFESFSHGRVVVDGSIPYPELGLLREPICLDVLGGRIVNITGDNKIVNQLISLFDSVDPLKSRVLAECGVGLNPLAKLSGIMLTDEGAMGTMHFGFGSNATVGGVNEVPFHLDFVFKAPTLEVDGIPILTDGVCVI